jgi:beta-glucanase (GH16 family)
MMAYRKLSLILLAAFFVFLGCDKVTAPKPVTDITGPTNYTLVWSDEFNQESSIPDVNNWGYDLGYGGGGWGNDEWQRYTNAPENVKVENGNLVISAVWDSVNYATPGKRDGSVTSARINSKNKFSVKYGKIEASIKVPTTMGMWPSFWMLGKNYDTAGWPQCGEIDIMEVSPLYHGANTAMSTLHWWDDTSSSHNSYGQTKRLSEPLSNDYHTYEVEWDALRIVGKIDGITYFVKTIDAGTMDEFFKEFFLIFNVAVGGNLGGTPDGTTNWPQRMYVDWVRVSQNENSLIPIETYGIFTDTTPVDDALVIGANAEIYVWESTLTAGNTAPYEGNNVLSWNTNGAAWFGAAINSNFPLDLSDFAYGTLKFRIKIPANVTFKIGISDTQNVENYVTFPANQTAYGLTRNGEWGQAVVPISALRGNVDLEVLSNVFTILEQNGTQCNFAIDDIYWDGGGQTPSSVSFDAASYDVASTSASITISDVAAAGTTVAVSVSNGTSTISVDVAMNQNGAGTGTLNFGTTNDNTNTILIVSGGSISASYTDSSGNVRTDTASITGASSNTMGIFSESHTNPMLVYSQIINSADWSGNPADPNPLSTAVTPVDGSYVLSVAYATGSAGWGAIAFNFGSQSIATYTTLVFSINKSAMPTLAHLGIKFEDASQGNTEVDLANYTPVISGNWARYEIPISHFSAVNLNTIRYLVLANPKTSGNVFIAGTLYFDDIHLKN